MKKRSLLTLFACAFLLLGNLSVWGASHLTDGRWRGEFLANGQQFPFVLEVKASGSDSTTVSLLNGQERVPLKGLKYVNDTVFVPIDSYDAVLKGTIRNNVFEGRFVKLFIDNDPGIPFVAKKTAEPRFPKVAISTQTKAEGRWDVQFISQDGQVSKNVGVFEQRNDTVTGSILTSSGDLRYLEGAFTADGFELSAFAGLSPYLLKVKFEGNDNFSGEFFTTRGVTRLIGVRNNAAKLDDPYSLTLLRDGYQRLSFSLPNVEGNPVSINDSRYKGKVVVVSILGSWCPNCLDEMKFLVPWYKQNKHRGVEIIGLAFERKDDPAYAKRVLSQLKERYGVEYEILFGGKVGEDATTKVLPEITKVISYPTTIFIDKEGVVSKIHTGFNGPATGSFYEEFKEDFENTISDLLKK
jgi:thiol-disulfide isomerase/thioredoxin